MINEKKVKKKQEPKITHKNRGEIIMCVLGIMNEMVKECENFESDRHLLATSVRFFVDLDLLLHRREEMKKTLELLLLNES